MGRKGLSPLAIAAEKGLGVGVVGEEPVALGDQLGAELGKIVDLTVKDDDKAAIGANHGLMAAREIEDGEPAVAEKDRAARVPPVAGVIRPPVGERVGHSREVGLASRADKARDSAHGQSAGAIDRGASRAPGAVPQSGDLSRFA